MTPFDTPGKQITVGKGEIARNDVEKGENATTQHFFLFFHNILRLYPKTKFNFSVTFIFFLCKSFLFGPV